MSYAKNYSGTDYPTSKTFGGVQEKLATLPQIKYYTDLCEQKQVEPKDVSNITSREIHKLIDELKSMAIVSIHQKDMIDRLIKETGVTIPVEILKKLTGGKEGSASKLIEQLLERKRSMGNELPPTEAQVKFLVDMFLCPDVAFEEFGIQKKRQIADDTFVLMTPAEFAEEVKAKIHMSEASAFIDKYRGIFFTWKNSRATLEQIKYIRSLEERLSTKREAVAIEFAISETGEVVELPHTKPASENNLYNKLSDLELAQMGKESAEKYINILKADLNKTELYSGFESEMNKKDETFEEIRIKDIADTDTLEDMLTDSLYKLSAMIGHEIVDYDQSIEDLDIFEIKELILELIENGEVNLAELQNIFNNKTFIAVMNA